MTDSPSTGDLSRLAVFHGDLHSQYAQVFARFPVPTAPGDWRLQGEVVGPRNPFTRTLPATVTLHDLGPGPPGPSLLARAIIPAPCFWAPGQPYLYEVHVELSHDGQVVASHDQLLGLRMFGVWEQQLVLESNPWRLLGAADTSVHDADWDDWRASGLVRWIVNPTADQCLEASNQGVMLIAQLDGDATANSEELALSWAQLSRYPAIALMAVNAGDDIPPEVQAAALNIRTAQICSNESELIPAPWADLLIYQTNDLRQLANHLADCPCPVLVQLGGQDPESLDDAAARCRELDETFSAIPGLVGIIA